MLGTSGFDGSIQRFSRLLRYSSPQAQPTKQTMQRKAAATRVIRKCLVHTTTMSTLSVTAAAQNCKTGYDQGNCTRFRNGVEEARRSSEPRQGAWQCWPPPAAERISSLYRKDRGLPPGVGQPGGLCLGERGTGRRIPNGHADPSGAC